jgi:cell division protein FtsB
MLPGVMLKKARIEELEKNRTVTVAENAELRARVVKLEQDIDELKNQRKIVKMYSNCSVIAWRETRS